MERLTLEMESHLSLQVLLSHSYCYYCSNFFLGKSGPARAEHIPNAYREPAEDPQSSMELTFALQQMAQSSAP